MDAMPEVVVIIAEESKRGGIKLKSKLLLFLNIQLAPSLFCEKERECIRRNDNMKSMDFINNTEGAISFRIM
jgi:hypothetical protein